MTSKIGIRNKAAFSLIEIMFATAIFALATVFIYEIFLRSMDNLNYCFGYFKVAPWIDDKMWLAQNELTRFNGLTDTPAEDVLTVGNRKVKWNLRYNAVEGMQDTYRIDSAAAWQEGRKSVVISRMAYAVYDKKEKI